MFGVSFFELTVIFLVALLAFGPEKLPQIARTLGKISGELKRASDAFRKELFNSVYTPADPELRDVKRSLTTSLDNVKESLRKAERLAENLDLPPEEPANTLPPEKEKEDK